MFFFRERKKKILILWYTHGHNLGDYYLFNTVRNYAIKWGFDVQDMDVGSPYKEIAKKAKKCDWVWFAGGGIIERWLPDVIEHFSVFYEEMDHKYYGVTGLSVGDFDYSDKKESLNAWVKNASFFYTRDAYSAKLLNSITGANSVIPSVDVVFAYDKFVFDHSRTESFFGINFREMPYPDLTGNVDWNLWNKAVAASINSKIVGIPDQHDVLGCFPLDFRYQYTPQNVIKAISKINFGLAMRYHVILISAICGKVCIPIDYCPKVSRLAVQLGIEDLILHYNEANKLQDMINQYKANEEFYKNKVKENVIFLRKEADRMFEMVEKTIKER